MITGQIGTGKDLVAEAIHHASSRSKNPFVTFRCGALPEFLIVLDGNDIAPRFDLTLELLIVSLGKGGKPAGKRDMVLARPSAEAVCRVVSAENAHTVICGGVEKDYLQYLEWKNVEVIHSVIGPAEVALRRFRKGSLKSGDILVKERKA